MVSVHHRHDSVPERSNLVLLYINHVAEFSRDDSGAITRVKALVGNATLTEGVVREFWLPFVIGGKSLVERGLLDAETVVNDRGREQVVLASKGWSVESDGFVFSEPVTSYTVRDKADARYGTVVALKTPRVTVTVAEDATVVRLRRPGAALTRGTFVADEDTQSV